GLPGIPPLPLVGFLGEAAEALDWLHARGMVHRNVKPTNLLRVKGRARVADLVSPRLPEDPVAVYGTVGFMAPEQWQGRASRLSDQYSLALVYHRMRTGRSVFSAGSSVVELAQQVLFGAEPDLSGLPESERGGAAAGAPPGAGAPSSELPGVGTGVDRG